jgi:hypothetical protein
MRAQHAEIERLQRDNDAMYDILAGMKIVLTELLRNRRRHPMSVMVELEAENERLRTRALEAEADNERLRALIAKAAVWFDDEGNPGLANHFRCAIAAPPGDTP